MKVESPRLALAVTALAVVVALLLAVLLRADGGWRAATAPDIAAAAGAAAVVADRQQPARGAPNGEGDSGEIAAGDDVSPQMRRQLADIARAYAENARYPSYAIPLAADDWAQLNPRAFVPRQAPLQALPGVTASIVLERSVVDRDSALPVRVVLSATAGEEGMVNAGAVRVLVQRQGQSSALVTLAREAATVFAGVLPATALQAVPAGELLVVAEIDFAGGERAVVTAMAKSYDSAARLLALGEPRVEGADLVIPARFEVAVAGDYRVQANLFTADGKTPVSHLNAEFPLAAGTAMAPLKVHAVTLRAAGEAGPYVLRDVDITRLPDQPGDATGYGSAVAASFPVRGFPLDAYSNEPWDDPEARQRLQFLQRLSSTQ